MTTAPPARGLEEPGVVQLSAGARYRRLAAAAVVLVLLLGGTVWGTDADFPSGPFRMYSTRADHDAPVVTTSVVGWTGDGRRLLLSGGEVGLRRAEFEGQLSRLVDRPELLGLLAEARGERDPDADPLVRIQVVQTRTQLAEGRPTGEVTDTVLVTHDLTAAP